MIKFKSVKKTTVESQLSSVRQALIDNVSAGNVINVTAKIVGVTRFFEGDASHQYGSVKLRTNTEVIEKTQWEEGTELETAEDAANAIHFSKTVTLSIGRLMDICPEVAEVRNAMNSVYNGVVANAKHAGIEGKDLDDVKISAASLRFTQAHLVNLIKDATLIQTAYIVNAGDSYITNDGEVKKYEHTHVVTDIEIRLSRNAVSYAAEWLENVDKATNEIYAKYFAAK